MKPAVSTGNAFLLALLLGTLVTLVACGENNDNGNGEEANNETETSTNADSASTPDVDVSDDAPEPAQVSGSDLTLISEWRAIGVPAFRGGEVLDFEPHQSQVENAGTILLDGDDATPQEIIAYYRGALRVLGWQELRVSAREMTAESGNASLLVTVSVHDDRTMIMMMVTDRIDAG